MGENRLTVIQALRGLAALWVVLYHVRWHVPSFAFLFEGGHYGVPIFFALSGFVITHSLDGATITPGFAGRFLLRRSIRLDPAYWLSMAVVVAFALFSAAVKGEAAAIPSAGDVIAHLFYAQVFSGAETINLVYWTLTYEVQFYAFLVLVLAFVPARTALVLMFGLAAIAAVGGFESAPHGLFLDLWPAFFVGVLARVGTPAALTGLAALSAAMVLRDGFSTVAALTAIGLLWACRTGWIDHGLGWRPLQFLGAISYSLYLTHNPVGGAAASVARRLVGTGLVAELATLALMIGACIAFAALFWLAIERPSHQLSRRIDLAARGERLATT